MKIVALFYRILVAMSVVGVLLAPAATTTTAQTNDYLVKVRFTSDTDDFKKIKFTKSGIVGSNLLVLRIIKNPPRQIQLLDCDASTTNVVSVLVTSYRQAFLANGKFSSDLEQTDPSFPDGDLQITGKETPATNPTKVKATLIGVWNDGVNNSNDDIDEIAKGTLTGTRLP